MTGSYQRPFVLALAVAACVPASEALPPAGAAGYTTEPSAAARGEPFVTSDGWTVRIQELVFQASVGATPLSRDDIDDPYGGSYGGSELYRWNARDRVDLFTPGLRLGDWSVSVSLRGLYRYGGKDDNYDDRLVSYGIDEALAFRFRPVESGQRSYVEGPSFLVIARGEKAGRVVTLDVALSADVTFSSTSLPYSGPRLAVREDSLTSAPLRVAGEVLFSSGLGFEAIASADADGDGRVDEAELAGVTTRCCGLGNTPTKTTLADALAKNAGGALQP